MTTTGRARLSILAVWWLPACGADAPSTPEAADAASDTLDAAPPDTASPPPGRACPAGSSRTGAHCRPDRSAKRADLDRCEWPKDPGTVLHVEQGATAAGADGSEARPYATLGAAIAQAGYGTTLLMHAGTYDGGIVLPAGVALVGRCAAEVTISGPVDGVAVKVKDVAGVRIEGVTLSGAAVGLLASGAADATIRRVRAAGNQRGIDLRASTALVEASEVSDTAPNPGPDAPIVPGRGIWIGDQSSVVLSAVTVEGSTSTGVTADYSEASLVGGCVVRKNGESNVKIQAGSAGLVEDADVSEAIDSAGGGVGILVIDAGEVVVRKTKLIGNHRTGIAVEGGELVVVEDSEIRGGVEGIRLQHRTADTQISKSTLANQVGAGMIALSSLATVGPGNVLQDIAYDPKHYYGDAIQVGASSTVAITANTFLRVAGDGVQVSSSSATIQDNEIEDTGEGGIYVQTASTATVSGNQLRRTTGYGVAVLKGGQARIVGNTFDGVRPGPAGVREGVLVAGAAALLEQNLYPEPSGIEPSPARAAFLVDGPLAPSSTAFLGLEAGVAVAFFKNVVTSATYGIATQGLAAPGLVVVGDDNDLTGATTKDVAQDLGLSAQTEPKAAFGAVDFGAPSKP